MAKILTLLTLLVLLLPAAAFAEPVPDTMLDADFKNCMGDETADKNPGRADYCNCIRDKLKTWDLDTYTNEATAQAQKSAQTPSAKLNEVASTCLAKTLK